jgi:hypothetical protein
VAARGKGEWEAGDGGGGGGGVHWGGLFGGLLSHCLKCVMWLGTCL